MLIPVWKNLYLILFNCFNFISLGRYELVFLNFYADWCRFSQMLAPIFEDAADKAAKEIPVRF